MTDEEKAAEAAKQAEEAKKAQEEAKKALKEKGADYLVDELLKANSESKERKLKLREFEDQLSKIESDKKKAKEKELEEQGKLKELLTAKEKEIELLNQTLKPKADEYDKFRQEEIENIKKILGDKWDDGFANLSLPALRKMAVTLTSKKDDPNTDKGSKGNIGVNSLTAEQKKEAYRMFANDSNPEQSYADYLSKREEIKKQKGNK